MVQAPGAYKWSSYAANAGMRADPLVVPHAEYVAISAYPERRQVAYRELVQEGDAPSFLDHIRSATNGGHGLVGEHVKTQVAVTGRSLERRAPGPRRKVAGTQPVNGELLP